MPVTITTHAVEESTFVITASFTDEADNPVTPNAGLVWSLTDTEGNVINAREDIGLTEATSVDIVLQGADLALNTTKASVVERVLIVEGTYDSTVGNNLPLKEEARFFIDGLVKIT